MTKNLCKGPQVFVSEYHSGQFDLSKINHYTNDTELYILALLKMTKPILLLSGR